MDMGDLPCCLPALPLVLRPSPLVPQPLLLVLGRQRILLHIFTPPPGHLPHHYRLPFGGEGPAKDLKQALLGRQPKAFTAISKKKKGLSLLPFPSPVSPLPLPFFCSLFIEDNENLKHGGVRLSLFGWNGGFWGIG